jgi:hypothetical protein
MDTSRKLEAPGGAAAHFTPVQWAENKKARHERKRGCRGRCHFSIYAADESSEQNAVDKDISNSKKNYDRRRNSVRKKGTGAFTNTKFNGPRTREGLRRRHVQLEAHIKQIKKNIAKHQESVEKEAEHNTEELKKKEEASKEEKAGEMELDIWF